MLSIAWLPRALDDFDRLDRKLQQRINTAIERLAQTGYGDVKRLQGSADYRLRVGQWRVRFARDDSAGTLTVLRVLPRGRAYR